MIHFYSLPFRAPDSGIWLGSSVLHIDDDFRESAVDFSISEL